MLAIGTPRMRQVCASAMRLRGVQLLQCRNTRLERRMAHEEAAQQAVRAHAGDPEGLELSRQCGRLGAL